MAISHFRIINWSQIIFHWCNIVIWMQLQPTGLSQFLMNLLRYASWLLVSSGTLASDKFLKMHFLAIRPQNFSFRLLNQSDFYIEINKIKKKKNILSILYTVYLWQSLQPLINFQECIERWEVIDLRFLLCLSKVNPVCR